MEDEGRNLLQPKSLDNFYLMEYVKKNSLYQYEFALHTDILTAALVLGSILLHALMLYLICRQLSVNKKQKLGKIISKMNLISEIIQNKQNKSDVVSMEVINSKSRYYYSYFYLIVVVLGIVRM